MPATKKRRRAFNLGQYVMPVSVDYFLLIYSLLSQTNQKQKQHHGTKSNTMEVILFKETPNTDNSEGASVDLGLHFLDRVSMTSETSTILTNLSEDNDVPAHADLNGLLTWLADGQKQLKSKFHQWPSTTKIMACKFRGPYKPKGTIQSQ